MDDDESECWLNYKNTYPNWKDTWGFDPNLEKRELRDKRRWHRVKKLAKNLPDKELLIWNRLWQNCTRTDFEMGFTLANLSPLLHPMMMSNYFFRDYSSICFELRLTEKQIRNIENRMLNRLHSWAEAGLDEC